jgi:hypothetical protein
MAWRKVEVACLIGAVAACSPAPAPVAPPAPPPAAPAAFAVCPALTVVPMAWQHEVHPGCAEMPFVAGQNFGAELVGGVPPACGVACGQPCAISSYSAYAPELARPPAAIRYDDRGRWIASAWPNPNYASMTCAYDGDRLAECTSVRDDGGREHVAARRDATGKLRALEPLPDSAPPHRPGPPAPLRLTYDARGNVIAEDLGPFANGRAVRIRYDRDAAGRLLAEHADTLDAAGHPVREPNTTTYRYTAAGWPTERVDGTALFAERHTYRFADGRLVESDRVGVIPELPIDEHIRMTIECDAHGRIRQQVWEHLLKGALQDHDTRAILYHYADDAACTNAGVR